MDINQVLKKAETLFFNIDGVEGIAQGKIGNDDCITIFVSVPETAEKLPATFHGYPVNIDITDTFQAQV